MARRIVLVSPLSPTAIATKLLDVLGDRDDAPKRGVTGQGSDSEMLLFYHRPNFKNSFRTQLAATIEPAGSGARIAGKLGTPGSAKVFMIAWFGFLAIFLSLVAVSAILSGGFDTTLTFLLVLPLGMAAFGLLLVKVGTWNGAADEAAILEFLKQTVQAVPE